MATQGLHPRNRHRDGYDLQALAVGCPELGPFLRRSPRGGLTVDFADPAAVLALNRALLQVDYGIRGWDLPPGYLCPPIPGRADYLHHVADLLAEGRGGIPRGASVRVLDLGTGANLVYPLLGQQDYGWSFVGTDIDPQALEAARRILAANPDAAAAIELRQQKDPGRILEGVLKAGERFDLSICNPPFFASAAEARAASRDKWRKLGRGEQGARRNFGGQRTELWCEGGELGFIRRLAAESARHPEACGWFTVLVSKSANLPGARHALRQAGAAEVRTVEMAQGQKHSRFLAWRFGAAS
ncbi:MAG TPA: 23S rRNA (adenine(1618)-N(6))-methyltransferase RlmF [Holophagaceae bacterium]|nr:23S rRNA (adenine(1618)-N(6))-methyltransferase RlmF [Holophagaceae bacterium]